MKCILLLLLALAQFSHGGVTPKIEPGAVEFYISDLPPGASAVVYKGFVIETTSDYVTQFNWSLQRAMNATAYAAAAMDANAIVNMQVQVSPNVYGSDTLFETTTVYGTAITYS